jgi:xanthine dehydrogenase small subunit
VILFLLNNKIVSCQLSPGLQLLDLIRYHENLKGTKIGCREGDCGACTVLVGSLVQGELRYLSMTSCLLPLANINGKHVVTIEGLNFLSGSRVSPELNAIQSALAAEGATQCGFCTPGFVVSLAGHCLNIHNSYKKAIASIDGNICRCTGYKSIERAVQRISSLLEERKDENPLNFAIRKKIVPDYFSGIKKTLLSIGTPEPVSMPGEDLVPVAGGTDLYVQKPEELVHSDISFTFDQPSLKNITRSGNKLRLGASVTVTELCESKEFNAVFPAFHNYSKLISSTPIRNMATIAGNIVNASPIGDLSIFLLALDAALELRETKSGKSRKILLKNFYLGYKQLDKKQGEILEFIEFEIPAAQDFFHFEKVSKRTHLDIASVNTAICLRMDANRIITGSVSAGGVAPIPKYLVKTSTYLSGKELNESLVNDVTTLAREEISPISDVRGSKEYKSLLLGQLIRAHFYQLFEKIKTPA